MEHPVALFMKPAPESFRRGYPFIIVQASQGYLARLRKMKCPRVSMT